jgi:cation-transporting ATPase E
MTTLQGFSEAEAASLRAAGQGNAEQRRPGRSYAAILRQSALMPLNLVLFGVSGVLLVLGLTLDAAVTALPVLGNVLVNAGLEASARYRLERLRILSAPRAVVIRDGRERPIDPAELVRGDLVVIGRGDQVVLDGELVDGEVEVDESLLSGESDGIVRRAGDALLSGSACVSGRGTMRVTGVGGESFANRLTARARTSKTERTPLQHDIDRLIATTAGLVVVVSAAVAVVSSPLSLGLVDRVQAAAVLVALVPQGLAIMITVTYALAALWISRAGALVQRINAVEAISRVDALVLDKTGTITAPRFEVRDTLAPLADPGEERRLLAAAVGSLPAGDRVGDAIRRWLAAPGGGPAPAVDAAASGDERPAVVDAVPFASARRWSGVVLPGGRPEAAVLGAPEVLLGDDTDPRLRQAVERWSRLGRRVVVLTRAETASLRDASGRPRLPDVLQPVLLFAFAEEIREDARETLAAFAADGVAVRVVSGDDPLTVAAIAAQAGLANAELSPLEGAALAALNDAALRDRVEDLVVVGRVAPDLKARLIRALRDGGHDVGMVGDGVNDILALNAANVGVAMESGSAASRAVADIVLLGDRFGVLPKAVEEGRLIIDGMRGAASLLLTRTLYMLLIVLGATLAGLPFPFSPRGSSLLALVTVGLPGLVVIAWARPVPWRGSLVGATLRFAVPAAVAVAAIAVPAYGLYLRHAGSVSLARSALVTITAACGTLLIPFLGAAADARLDRRRVALAVGMAALYAAILALPIGRWLFEIEPIAAGDAVGLALLALAWALALSALRDLRGRALMLPHWPARLAARRG